jgi:hypothetical protein
MNEQQVLETQEVVALHNKQKQLDYMMQLATDAIKEVKATQPMNGNFIRIGHQIVNLAQITSINLNAKNWNSGEVVSVGFGEHCEVWFQGEDYETAKAFFTSIAQEVK